MTHTFPGPFRSARSISNEKAQKGRIITSFRLSSCSAGASSLPLCVRCALGGGGGAAHVEHGAHAAQASQGGGHRRRLCRPEDHGHPPERRQPLRQDHCNRALRPHREKGGWLVQCEHVRHVPDHHPFDAVAAPHACRHGHLAHLPRVPGPQPGRNVCHEARDRHIYCQPLRLVAQHVPRHSPQCVRLQWRIRTCPLPSAPPSP